MDARPRDLDRNATDLPQTGQQRTFSDTSKKVPSSSVTVDARGYFEGANRTQHRPVSLEHKVNTNFKREPSVLDPDFPCYKMDARPRGICLIINNREFDNKPELTRDGSELDLDKLADIFGKLHFKVLRKENLKDHDMIRELSYVATTDHTQYDCFVCCILSHGTKDKVYGSNDIPVEIGKLTSMVQPTMCPTLIGKPKVFFIQACQGNKPDKGVDIQTDGPNDKGSRQLIPTEADFLLGYATVSGYVSFRFTNKGSTYIDKLVAMLTEYHERTDLLSILTKVNDEVSKMDFDFEEEVCKQMPKIESTLRKRLVFM